MSLIFCDSFEHYNTITDKWDSNGTDCTIRRPSAAARTGNGCLQINSAAFGPTKNFSNVTNLMAGSAFNTNNSGCTVLHFLDFTVGVDAVFLKLVLNADLSLSVQGRQVNGQFQVLGTSAQGVFHLNVYNTVAMQANQQLAPNGFANVWCNGVQVLALTGIRTQGTFSGGGNSGSNVINACQLMGPGLIPVCFHDDVWLFDCSAGGPNSTFPGNVRVFMAVPFANGAPINWVPSIGSNFAAVATIPPDPAFNVESFTLADIDQYQYNATGVPPLSQIDSVQHVMDMKVSSGVRKISSDVNGIVNATQHVLPAGFVMFTDPYDLNPSTGLPWVLGDFPAQFGPKVVA